MQWVERMGQGNVHSGEVRVGLHGSDRGALRGVLCQHTAEEILGGSVDVVPIEREIVVHDLGRDNFGLRLGTIERNLRTLVSAIAPRRRDREQGNTPPQ